MNEPPFGIAVYKCDKCGHTWSGPPGMQGNKTSGFACANSKCDSLYCTWINFEWWKKEYKRFLVSINSPQAAYW